MKKYNITKDFLIKEYTKNKNSTTQIAKEVGCSHSTIYRKLIKYNIPRRSISESQKGKLHWNYKDGRTLKRIKCLICKKKLSRCAFVLNCKHCHKCANIKSSKLRIKNRRSYKGKFNPSFGKVYHGKWGIYKGILMRSNWEIDFAQFLDLSGHKFLYESKTFDLGNTTYTPDFYLPKFNCYIEIKGYWRKDAKKKFRLFRRLYPEINIEIFDYNKLKEMGII